MDGIKKANIYMFSLIAYILSFTVIFSFALNYLQEQSGGVYVSSLARVIISQFFTLAPPIAVYFFATKKRVTDVLSFKRIGIKNILLIILLGFLIQPFMMLLSAISLLFFSNNIAEVVSDFTENSTTMTVGFLAISICPAIFEEFNLRGIVYHGYKNAPIWVAAIVNGLFFGILHLDPQQFLYAFMVGILFTYLVFFTKSIFSAMLLHFVVNASQMLLMFAAQTAEGVADSQAIEAIEITPLGTVLYTLVFTLITAPLLSFIFFLFIKHNKKRLSAMTPPDDDALPSPFCAKSVLNPAFFGVIALYVVFILLFYI